MQPMPMSPSATMWTLRNLHTNALLTPLGHSGAAARERDDLLSIRADVTGRMLAALLIAWIPIDALTLGADLLALILPARLATALLLLALSRRMAVNELHERPLMRLGGMCVATAGFFIYASLAIAHANASASEFALMLYSYAPLLMVVALSLYPLTLLESVVAAFPLGTALAMMATFGHAEAQVGSTLATIWGFLVVAALAALASMSQLQLLLRMTDKTARDALTGAWARAIGNQIIATQFASAIRKKEPFTVLFVDLDRFKLVNDEFGHAAGDELLRAVAGHLESVTRQQDSVIRWGGEEFLLLLPGTDATGALTALRRIARSGVGTRPDGSVQTLSIGIASLPVDKVSSWTELVEVADQRMYASKQAGRNRYLGPGSSAPVTIYTEHREIADVANAAAA